MAQEYYRSEFFRFHNGMRILLNIDASEFPGPEEDWPEFRDNPHRYFITCGDETASALWVLIEKRNQRVVDRLEEREAEDRLDGSMARGMRSFTGGKPA